MKINPIVVQELIQYLNELFPSLHYEFTKPFSWERDSFSYYLNGHCFSFARILMAIFSGNAIPYISDKHVIIKIDDNFFDVWGLIYDNIQGYHVVDNNYISLVFDNSDSLEKELELALIDYGREKYRELLNDTSFGLEF